MRVKKKKEEAERLKDQGSKRQKDERSDWETVGRWEGRKVRKTAVGSRQLAYSAGKHDEQ